MTRSKLSNRERFLNTHSGRTLECTYPLTKEGLWQVRGEDPNCDLGGSHHMPDLGMFDGTLDEVIDIAVELQSFWQWGGGGSIELVEPAQTKLKKSKPVATVLSTKFVLSGVKKDGTEVFYAYDSHSGGYPYWSPNVTSAATWDTVDKVPATLDSYLKAEVVQVRTLRVETTGTVVSSEDVVSVLKQNAMREVAEIERVLAEKVAALEKMP